MERQIFCFVDSVSGNVGEIFTLANRKELRREFRKICENPAVPAYAVRDVIVLHLGTFHCDPDNIYIESLPVPITVLRGGSFDVDEIRRQASDDAVAASELHSV